MRKILFTVIFSAVLILSFISYKNVSSQVRKPVDENETAKTAALPASTAPDDSELEDLYTPKWLRNDMRVSDVVAYVDVKEVKLAGRSDEDTDCENNTAGGYCGYLLIADVKEVFKGQIRTKQFEFYESADASYPKKYLFGEQVVFLLLGEEDKDKKRNLGTMENSTRRIEHNVLEKLRNILNPNSPVDETDVREPYSIKYIKTNFEEADAVVYADVVSFKPDKDGFRHEAVLQAKTKEVFKGKLKPGQTFEYKDDLLYRPMNQEDLGEQVIYLKKSGKTLYEKIEYTEGWIQHDILEKLRKIKQEASNEKN